MAEQVEPLLKCQTRKRKRFNLSPLPLIGIERGSTSPPPLQIPFRSVDHLIRFIREVISKIKAIKQHCCEQVIPALCFRHCEKIASYNLVCMTTIGVRGTKPTLSFIGQLVLCN